MTKEKIQALQANTANMSVSASTFANSMIRQFNQKGNLSEKQWFYVDKLNKEAEEAALKLTVAAVAPKADTVALGSFEGIHELFENAASSRLKAPKIRLMMDGVRVVLSVAQGERAKYPGTVNLKESGGYGATWYGRVERDGTWTPSGSGRRVQASMTALLTALAADPVGVAAEHGKLMGRCCFCFLPLDDARSTMVGYGPVCAKNWKLPWG